MNIYHQLEQESLIESKRLSGAKDLLQSAAVTVVSPPIALTESMPSQWSSQDCLPSDASQTSHSAWAVPARTGRRAACTRHALQTSSGSGLAHRPAVVVVID